LCVTNNAGSSLEDVVIRLTFPEGVYGSQKTDPEDLNLSNLIPVLFKERNQDLYSTLLPPSNQPYVSSQSYPLDWENRESLVITIRNMDLRPDSPWTNDDDDLVVVVHDESIEIIEVDWKLTAKGHHTSYSGKLSIPVDLASVADDVNATILSAAQS
jgi:hypothetical protein